MKAIANHTASQAFLPPMARFTDFTHFTHLTCCASFTRVASHLRCHRCLAILFVSSAEARGVRSASKAPSSVTMATNAAVQETAVQATVVQATVVGRPEQDVMASPAAVNPEVRDASTFWARPLFTLNGKRYFRLPGVDLTNSTTEILEFFHASRSDMFGFAVTPKTLCCFKDFTFTTYHRMKRSGASFSEPGHVVRYGFIKIRMKVVKFIKNHFHQKSLSSKNHFQRWA